MTIRVPQFTANARLRGRNQQGVRVNASAEAFGAAVGRGMQALAGGINSAADAMEARDALKAEADARQALNTYRDTVRSGLYDPQTGYLVQTGDNALGDARENAHANLAEARSAINEGLSPAAQRIFSQSADALDNSAQDSTIKHQGVEFRNFTLQSFEASAQGYLDDAILNAGNDAKFNDNMAAAERELRAAAALQGVAPEQIDRQVEALKSSGHAGRVVSLARTNPVQAFEYLKEAQGEMDATEFDRLHRGLEPAYYAGLAREWVSRENGDSVLTGTADVDQFGVPSWISGPESGGRSDAENPYSSATGRVQFIDDTWMRYVDQLQPAWAEGKTRDEVLAMRKDPKAEGEIYRAFRADNQAALHGMGREVTPRNEYMMHHLGGKVTQALLLAEEMGTTSASFSGLLAQVLGEQTANEWVRANPWMQGRTAGGALSWFQGKVGEHGASVAQSGGIGNPTLLMSRAVEIDDPKLRRATLEELEMRTNVSNAVRNENNRVAQEQAWEIIDGGGTASDIPPDLQVQVGAQTMNTIFETLERRAAGIDHTDEARYLELFDLATQNPEQFAQLDLNEDRPNLSQGDLRQLKTMQNEMNQDRAIIAEQGASAVVYQDSDYRQAMNDAAEQFQAATGVAPGSAMDQEQMQQYNRFTQQLRRGMRQFADENGRPMTFDERTSFINTLMAPVVIEGVNDGFFGGDRFLFEAPSMARGGSIEPQYRRGDVPPDVEQQITESLTTLFGRSPTEDEVVEQYENEVLLSVGVPPNVTYREIPRDIRRQITDENPGASREEIVEVFRMIVLEAANRHVVQ